MSAIVGLVGHALAKVCHQLARRVAINTTQFRIVEFVGASQMLSFSIRFSRSSSLASAFFSEPCTNTARLYSVPNF